MITKHQLIQQKHTVSGSSNRNLTFEEGRGVFLIDGDGNEYLDMVSNFGVNVLGYQNKEIQSRLKNQIDKLANLHSSFNNSLRSEATLKLVNKVKKSGLEEINRVFWSSSGAEAVEAALKYAILTSGKNKFIAIQNGYHGKTLGALSATSSSSGKYKKPFEKNLLETSFVPFGDVEAVEKALTEDVAALVLEPIQGEGGVILPPENYLSKISKVCRDKGVLLIIDEIQTGVGRTGYFLNVEKYMPEGFRCDILCLGKGLAGGVPVGATIITDEINKKLPKGIHTSTFGGNLLTMAGVDATLDYIEKNQVVENCQEVGKYFMSELSRVASKYPKLIKEVRGEGLMVGVETGCNSVVFVKAFQEKKILVTPSNRSAIRFLPPLIVKKEHIDIVVKTLEEICQNLNGNI